MIRQNIVVVMGSHRKNGNTQYFTKTLVDKLSLENLYPQLVDVNSLAVKPCIDCNYCKDNWGTCIHNDDMLTVYERFREADVLIVASPVYFNGPTSKLKTLVDRCQMIFMCDFEHRKPFVNQIDFEKKLGYIVSVGGANEYPNQFVGNEMTLKLVFDNLRVPLTNHIKYFGTDHRKLDIRDEVSRDVDEIVDKIHTHLLKINANV
ncbi:flavodoxin family protein [Fusibacter bizertensis]